MSIAVAVLLPLAGAMIALIALMYRAFRRPPANSPKAFRTHGRPAGTHTVAVALGDSLTHATLSADWVGVLRERLGPDGYAFVNAGLNGDTTADLLRRLDEAIACDPDAITVLIGTNDARNGVPVDEFRTNLENIVARLRAHTTARIALLSAPPLGEDLAGLDNQRLAPYNAVIKETADRTGVTYLAAYERLAEPIRRNAAAPRFAFSFGLAFGVAVQHYLLRRTLDDIAARNGLTILTDHIHLADQASAILADLVAAWLTHTRHPAPTR